MRCAMEAEKFSTLSIHLPTITEPLELSGCLRKPSTAQTCMGWHTGRQNTEALRNFNLKPVTNTGLFKTSKLLKKIKLH